jgi:hypothetical protein
MKNQLMPVKIGDDVVSAYHKTGEVSLTDIFRAGNSHRLSGGKSVANMSMFLNSEATKEFIRICERESGSEVVRVEGKGNKKATFVCMPLAIYAAQYLSKEFHYKTIDHLINSGIFISRDDGGENFKAVNILIETLEDRKGKANSRGCFIWLAKQIKHHVNPDLANWNEANAAENRKRADIEDDVCRAIKWGHVKAYEPDLKDFVSKILK